MKGSIDAVIAETIEKKTCNHKRAKHIESYSIELNKDWMGDNQWYLLICLNCKTPLMRSDQEYKKTGENYEKRDT